MLLQLRSKHRQQQAMLQNCQEGHRVPEWAF